MMLCIWQNYIILCFVNNIKSKKYNFIKYTHDTTLENYLKNFIKKYFVQLHSLDFVITFQINYCEVLPNDRHKVIYSRIKIKLDHTKIFGRSGDNLFELVHQLSNKNKIKSMNIIVFHYYSINHSFTKLGF